MQINFEPEKIKAAKAYVNRLNPTELPESSVNNDTKLDKDFYATEPKPSFIKNILNFLFK